MIATIVKKDFLTNLVSPRFAIGFILCLVLIPFSILINISNYRDRMAQYRLDRDAAEKATTEVRVYSTLRPEVVLPPDPLSVFGKGLSDQVGNRVRIWLGDKPLLAAGKTAAGDNPFLASFLLRGLRRHRGHRLLAAGAHLQLRRLHPREGRRHAEAADVQLAQPVDRPGRQDLGHLPDPPAGPRLLVPPQRRPRPPLAGRRFFRKRLGPDRPALRGQPPLSGRLRLHRHPRFGPVQELGHEPRRVPLPVGPVRLHHPGRRGQLRAKASSASPRATISTAS